MKGWTTAKTTRIISKALYVSERSQTRKTALWFHFHEILEKKKL